jgi:tetratricopeptide (TPR) repeat protein
MCRRFIAILLLSGLFRAQAAVEDEIRFVEQLTAEGFPNLARTVLARTLQQFPGAEKSAPELRIRILIAEKKFDEAASSISDRKSSLVNPEALWLFLAETASGDQAATAYQNYFALTKTPDVRAAFNCGELLEQRGNGKSARALYENVLSFPTVGKSARPVKVKLAKLLVEENPDRAKKLCEDVQLGGLDIWFGQAVVIWADIMIRKGEWSEAQSVLETQLETLKSISDTVSAADVPVAGARCLLGACYEHAGKKAEALHQFYNVYAKYGDSEWGPQAQEKAQALKAEFEAQGKTVQIDLGANLAKMEESAFRVARRLFFDKRYTDAVPAYLEALNQYPEGDESITALRELTQSYISLNDPLGAKTIAAYTGERFAAREAAADALLAAGKRALDEKQDDLAWWIYGRYFEFFPKHPRAPAVLYSLSELRKNEDCLFQCLENYPDSPYAARAISRLAWNAYEKENYAVAAERFEKALTSETDFEKQTRARFALGESYRQLAQQAPGSVGDIAPPNNSGLLGGARLSERAAHAWKQALKNFQTLEVFLTEAAERHVLSDETTEFNQPFLEKSLFYQGVCLAKLGEHENAVRRFDRFIETFQGSEFLPQAQIAKGSALMELKRYDDALAAFAVFDDSSDRKFLEPALFYRGQAFFETGRYNESVQCLEKLLNTWPESAFYFEAKLVQGRAYAAAGKKSDAVRVLSDLLDFASDELLLNRASLELGRAQTDPAEKLASFQRVALLADPEKCGDLIADALLESLPLYLELNRPQDLLADADRLLTEFPEFGHVALIGSLKTEAELLQEELTADNAD